MQLKDLLITKKTSKATNKRAYTIELIVTELNKEREAMNWQYFDSQKKQFKKLGFVTGKQIAVKLAHIPTQDLHSFYSRCLVYSKEKGSFGKCMFGILKNEKSE